MSEKVTVHCMNLKTLIESMGDKTFSVTFRKQNKEMRTMTTRNKTTKGVKGTGSAIGSQSAVIRRQDMQLLSAAGVKAKAEGRKVTFKEEQSTWRSIPLDRVTEVRGKGKVYVIGGGTK